MEKGYKVDADILLATDPDADRLGVAVKKQSRNIYSFNWKPTRLSVY